MVIFEIFVKSMPPSLSELKVLPSFCFAFKIPDDVTASSMYVCTYIVIYNPRLLYIIGLSIDIRYLIFIAEIVRTKICNYRLLHDLRLNLITAVQNVGKSLSILHTWEMPARKLRVQT